MPKSLTIKITRSNHYGEITLLMPSTILNYDHERDSYLT